MSDSPQADPSLSARLLQAQDEERRRISRELHDSVGQSLSATKMHLGKLDESGDGATPDQLRELGGLIDAAIREVRTVSYLLHPAALDFYGLSPAIREYANGFSKRSGIELRVDIPETIPRLLCEKETAIFRIVQECLTNIHRYASATHAWIVISLDEDLQLEVGDDGKGIAGSELAFTSETRPSLGVGIQGMRERVRELGGAFEIRSNRPGTRILATIPLSEEERAGTIVGTNDRPAKRRQGRFDRANGRGSVRSRILIIDDHELMRRGVRTLIENEPNWEVCGEADNVRDAVRMIEELKPHVVVLDLQLPVGSGWDVVQQIRHFPFWTKVLIFSGHDRAFVSKAARSAKCEGVISKSRAGTDLIEALRTVLSGQTYYPDESVRQAVAAAKNAS